MTKLPRTPCHHLAIRSARAPSGCTRRCVRLQRRSCQLHRLGREYPDPNYQFIPKLRAMFRKNAHLTDNAEIESKLALGEFVRKGTCHTHTETESRYTRTHPALYSLKKYRTLRRRYIEGDS